MRLFSALLPFVALVLSACVRTVNTSQLESAIRERIPRDELLELVRHNPGLVDHALIALAASPERNDRCDPLLLTGLFDLGARSERTYAQLIDYGWRNDYANETAFEKLVGVCPVASLELFLARWPDLTSRPSVGHQAVKAAARAAPDTVAERMEVFRYLLARGASFDFRPMGYEGSLRSEQDMAIHVAASGCHAHHLEMAEAILDHGPYLNGRDGYGRTALHRAVGKECLSMARLLLERGADPNIKGYEGETALNEARDLDGEMRKAMMELLESRGAVATSEAEREEIERREHARRDRHRDDYKREQAEREEAYQRAETERRMQENRARIEADQQQRRELEAMKQHQAAGAAIPGAGASAAADGDSIKIITKDLGAPDEARLRAQREADERAQREREAAAAREREHRERSNRDGPVDDPCKTAPSSCACHARKGTKGGSCDR